MSGRLDGQVPADAAEHLLSALREALSNAARHASATKVEVTVEAGRELVLLVRDDGTGLKQSTRRSGLANLAERAALLGGTIRMGPADGGGTQLEWRVPLHQPNRRDARIRENRGGASSGKNRQDVQARTGRPTTSVREDRTA
jgi:nitrate/nitrite-specific signal transduction histidine kinase